MSGVMKNLTPKPAESSPKQSRSTATLLPSTAAAPGPRDSAEKNASLGTVDEGPRKRQRRHAKVSKTRGPAHQQTRAGIVRKKNSTPYRTWRVRFADLRAEIGDHQFYKTATLTNPQNAGRQLGAGRLQEHRALQHPRWRAHATSWRR